MPNRKDELLVTIKRARTELDNIEQTDTEQRIRPLIGTCYKYRNSYSCPSKPSDYWWLYMRVDQIKDGMLRCFEFQTDRDGNIRIEQDRAIYDTSLSSEYVKIPLREFAKQWQALKNCLDRMA